MSSYFAYLSAMFFSECPPLRFPSIGRFSPSVLRACAYATFFASTAGLFLAQHRQRAQNCRKTVVVRLLSLLDTREVINVIVAKQHLQLMHNERLLGRKYVQAVELASFEGDGGGAREKTKE